MFRPGLKPQTFWWNLVPPTHCAMKTQLLESVNFAYMYVRQERDTVWRSDGVRNVIFIHVETTLKLSLLSDSSQKSNPRGLFRVSKSLRIIELLKCNLYVLSPRIYRIH